ncbi:hypothetical protein AKJ16_DCAP18888 [Drosera capensis]
MISDLFEYKAEFIIVDLHCQFSTKTDPVFICEAISKPTKLVHSSVPSVSYSDEDFDDVPGFR